MTEIEKEKQKIIDKFGMKPSLLNTLPRINKEEFRQALEEYKAVLINFIRGFLK